MAGQHNWRHGLSWPSNVDADKGGAVEYLYEDDDGATHSVFGEERALAAMLLSEAIFLNSNWWMKGWPEEARDTVALCVNTNDVFAWGCADAEDITHDEIEAVYRYWAKDPQWGTAVWAIIRRKELPQRPVAASIRKAGIWDMDALAKEHGLRPNAYDGLNSVSAGLKYAAYSAWERLRGREPQPFDAKWWAGWREYIAANPEWHSAEWKAEEERRLAEFKVAAGFAPPATPSAGDNCASEASQSALSEHEEKDLLPNPNPPTPHSEEEA